MSDLTEEENQQPRLLKLVSENWSLFRPFVVGTTIFALLFLLIWEFRDSKFYLEYISLVTQWTSKLVDAFGIPHSLDSVSGLVQDMVRTNTVNVEWIIDSSSDGLIVIAMAIAALFSIKGTASRRALFLSLGIAVFLALTPLSIALGIFFEQHFPLQQTLLNNYILPTLTGFLPLGVLLLAWYKYSGKNH